MLVTLAVPAVVNPIPSAGCRAWDAGMDKSLPKVEGPPSQPCPWELAALRCPCSPWLPTLLGSPTLAKRWHRTAVLNNSGFVLAAEHTRLGAEAPCPSGCGTYSPLPPRCSVSLAAQPWRQRFQSLPARQEREGWPWRGSQPRFPLFPRAAGGSPWHTCCWCRWVWTLMLAQAGSCCATRHRPSGSCWLGKDWSSPLCLCLCLCVHLPPNPACWVPRAGKRPRLLGRGTWLELCSSVLGTLSLVTSPLQ